MGISLLLALSALLHDFKMSVSELIFDPSDRHWEIKVYLFTDDLTQAISGDPKAALPARNAIDQYVQQHLQVYVDGVRQPLQCYSIRQKEEQTLVQFQTPGMPNVDIKKVRVVNQLLTQTFREQTNMVYLIVPGKSKKTSALDAGRMEAVFDFIL